MGNKIGTLKWDPSPKDSEIQIDLARLRARYSLADTANSEHWEANKTIFSVENAGIWRMIISDENVTRFLNEAMLMLKNKYQIEPKIYEDFLMM